MEKALASVRSQFGREYDLRIDGERVRTGDLLESVNPSKPSEIVGRHHKATPELAVRAIEGAAAYFEEWRFVPVDERVAMLLRAAAILRDRKYEFNAWLIYEAGKSWVEAEADTCEAIDFCEYYARQMRELATPKPLVQMPGERDRMVYLPLGVGVVIPPWNFPLAILVGMTTAALVTGFDILFFWVAR
ncbi:MAG TPA: L-glutamate gamma-semialdehyde dehydrogenase, partial [Solibacterales bacterium]|nr:L-glutamate gamma-semialdehyde dehydrogenase [Bryobacterales bacterium]